MFTVILFQSAALLAVCGIDLHDRTTNSSDTGVSIQNSNKELILRVRGKPLKH